MKKYKSNLKKRIYASLLDYGLFLICCFAYIIFFGESDGEGNYSLSGLAVLPIVIFWIIYFVISEATLGGTLGHQSFNLKVLTLHGEEIGLSESIKRRFLDPVDFFFFGLIAFLTVKNSEKHQRVGDTVAKTCVIDLTDPDQNLKPLRPFN